MALPTYDKTKRRKSFAQLPKGALGAFQADECENDIMIVIKALEDY